MTRLSDLSEAMLGEMVGRSQLSSLSFVSTGVVIDTQDYRVRVLSDTGEASPWLHQFCSDSAVIDDIVIYWVSDGFGAYFGIMQPRSHTDETIPDTEYTTPRIASDIYTEDQLPEPQS